MGVRDPGSFSLGWRSRITGPGPPYLSIRPNFSTKGASPMAELTIGGKSYTLAPLRLAQVAKAMPGIADVKLDRVEGILLAVAYSLMNGGAFAGESAEDVANTVDVGASSGDVQQAYMAIMLMTGSQRHSTGKELVANPE